MFLYNLRILMCQLYVPLVILAFFAMYQALADLTVATETGLKEGKRKVLRCLQTLTPWEAKSKRDKLKPQEYCDQNAEDRREKATCETRVTSVARACIY